MIDFFDDSLKDKVLKIDTIRFRRDNFESSAEYYQAISDQITLLLKNSFIVSIFNDLIDKQVIIEFSSCAPTQLKAVPVWMTPEDYIKYVTLIAEEEKDYNDDLDDEKNKA